MNRLIKLQGLGNVPWMLSSHYMPQLCKVRLMVVRNLSEEQYVSLQSENSLLRELILSKDQLIAEKNEGKELMNKLMLTKEIETPENPLELNLSQREIMNTRGDLYRLKGLLSHRKILDASKEFVDVPSIQKIMKLEPPAISPLLQELFRLLHYPAISPSSEKESTKLLFADRSGISALYSMALSNQGRGEEILRMMAIRHASDAVPGPAPCEPITGHLVSHQILDLFRGSIDKVFSSEFTFQRELKDEHKTFTASFVALRKKLQAGLGNAKVDVDGWLTYQTPSQRALWCALVARHIGWADQCANAAAHSDCSFVDPKTGTPVFYISDLHYELPLVRAALCAWYVKAERLPAQIVPRARLVSGSDAMPLSEFRIRH